MSSAYTVLIKIFLVSYFLLSCTKMELVNSEFIPVDTSGEISFLESIPKTPATNSVFSSLSSTLSQDEIVIVNSANYILGSSPNGLASLFFTEKDIPTALAEFDFTTQSYPNILNGIKVLVDNLPAQILFISKYQINILIPITILSGMSEVLLIKDDIEIASGKVNISNVHPGIYSMRSNGLGLPAGQIFNNGFYDLVFDEEKNGTPIDVSPEGENSEILVLYGTGLRNRNSIEEFKIEINNTSQTIISVTPQSQFPGLDQINIELSKQLEKSDSYWAELKLYYNDEVVQTLKICISGSENSSSCIERGEKDIECNESVSNVGYSRVSGQNGQVYDVWYPSPDLEISYKYGTDNRTGLVAPNGKPKRCGQTPTVLFSHGNLSCGFLTAMLIEEWVRAGVSVVAPLHSDATCKDEPPTGFVPNFGQPQDWDSTSVIFRRDEIRASIEDVKTNKTLGDIINTENILYSGHSLGGYSVYGLAGGWDNWKDSNAKALLLLSPYLLPYVDKDRISQINIPVMFQGGTLDIGITPFIGGDTGIYSQSNPTKYFLNILNANHFDWTYLSCPDNQSFQSCIENIDKVRVMEAYSTAFIEKHLLGIDRGILNEVPAEAFSYQFEK